MVKIHHGWTNFFYLNQLYPNLSHGRDAFLVDEQLFTWSGEILKKRSSSGLPLFKSFFFLLTTNILPGKWGIYPSMISHILFSFTLCKVNSFRDAYNNKLEYQKRLRYKPITNVNLETFEYTSFSGDRQVIITVFRKLNVALCCGYSGTPSTRRRKANRHNLSAKKIDTLPWILVLFAWYFSRYDPEGWWNNLPLPDLSCGCHI